jgi:hypothetical protein
VSSEEVLFRHVFVRTIRHCRISGFSQNEKVLYFSFILMQNTMYTEAMGVEESIR